MFREYNQEKDERENPELSRKYCYCITRYPVKYSEVQIFPLLKKEDKISRLRQEVARLKYGGDKQGNPASRQLSIRAFLERKGVPRISRAVFFHKRYHAQEIERLLHYRPHSRLIMHICCPDISETPDSITYDAQDTGWLYLLHHYCFVPHNWMKTSDKHLDQLPQYKAVQTDTIWYSLQYVLDHYARMIDFESAVYLFSYMLFSSCKSLFYKYRTISGKGGKISAEKLHLSLLVPEQQQEVFQMFMEPLVGAFMIFTNAPEDAETSASVVDQMIMQRDGEFSYTDRRKPVSALANQMHDACFLIWDPPKKGKALGARLDSAGSFLFRDTEYRNDPTFLCVPFASDSAADWIDLESNGGFPIAMQALQTLFHGYVGYLSQAMNEGVQKKLQEKLWKLDDEFDKLPACSPVPPEQFEQEPIIKTITTPEELWDQIENDENPYKGSLYGIDEDDLVPVVDVEATEERHRELTEQNSAAQKRIWLQRELTYPRPVRSNRMDQFHKDAKRILNKRKGVHDQETVAQHAPLLAMLLSFYDYLKSLPCNEQQEQIRSRVLMIKERAITLMATRCLERPPLEQVCKEDNAIELLAEFIDSLDASDRIENPEGVLSKADRYLGWRREEGGQKVLFLDYKLYFNAFTEYCEEQGYVMQLSEHRFVREVLYPLGIVTPRSRRKDGTPYRYDYLKVLRKGEGKREVLYMREDKLREAATSQSQEKRS